MGGKRTLRDILKPPRDGTSGSLACVRISWWMVPGDNFHIAFEVTKFEASSNGRRVHLVHVVTDLSQVAAIQIVPAKFVPADTIAAV